MSKKILSAIVALVVVFAMFIPTASAAIVTPVADAADFNKVVDGWYISADGGFKMNVGTWVYYGNYGLTLVEDAINFPTNCCTVAIYPSSSSSYDAPEVFENKTKEAFESVLSETVDVFEKTTIGNAKYTMYYAKTATYENYVFQTENAKYFINFIYASGDKEDLAAFAAAAIDSIVLADDPAPTEYDVIYYVDGVEYARETYEIGAAITAIEEPTKEGYTFSGWSEIPEVMGEEDVIVNGTFNPATGDSTAIITVGAIAVLAFVAIIASKKRATSR